MKRGKRFIFDTNVLVSAMLFPRSVPALALKRALNPGVVVVSVETMDELARVVTDNKFERYASFTKRQLFLIDFENVLMHGSLII